MPRWAAAQFLDSGYITEKKITKNGLMSELFAAVRREGSRLAYMQMMKETMGQMFSDVKILD